MAQIRYSFGKANKNDRSFQMSKQEELIEQKKREIEERLAERKRKEADEAAKKTPQRTKKLAPDGTKSRIIQQPIAPAPTIDTSTKIKSEFNASSFGFNAFSNDGSFMDQFIKSQKTKSPPTTVTIKQEILSPPHDGSSSGCSTGVPGICMKLQASVKNSPFPGIISSVPSVFRDDEDNKFLFSPPDDVQLKIQVDALAQKVADEGPAFEEMIKQECRDSPEYQFLYDTNDEIHKYYQQRIIDITQAKQKMNNLIDSCDKNGHLSDSDGNSSSSGSKRRKSRWGPQEPSLAAVPPQVVVGAVTPIPTLNCSPALLMSSPGLVAYALKVFGTTDLTQSQWTQLEEQMKMRILVEYLMVKKRESEKLAQQGKVKYEYDSDEEVDGGTWEHKRRMEEMEKTRGYADMLTDMGRGKHHIGDFLPPEELSKFMEKYEAIKAGRDADVSDYKEFKLTEDNIGYRMLQKLGWKEGMGLGADGSGITAPINKAAAPVENSGFGQGRPDEIKQGDDEYDAYRKRMMLAYRFRPNPLNNPRRPYY